MWSKQPLVRRIIIAFVLMTVVVSGFFSLGIVGIVHYIEQQLVSNDLNHELDTILENDLKAGRPPQTQAHTRFFASHLPRYAIPPAFAAAGAGFTEIVDGEAAYYVYKRRVNGVDYLLVEDQQAFEARETRLYLGVLAVFLGSLLLAWVIGSLVARQAIAPVVRLAHQVRDRDQLIAIAPPLAREYSRDEVGDLASAFDKAIGQLQAVLQREHLFTSDVSHELRTPLMVIASSCELLQESSRLSEIERAQVQRIQRACREMRELVATFLMLARADSPHADDVPGVTLQQAAAEQYQLWQDKFAAKGLAFELVPGAARPDTYHAVFLNTVISNLLRNALHYTDHGHVRLVLDGDGFRVEDSGRGIPLALHQHIFQPFTRGPQQRGEGYGLGLSLVKRICEQQGWEVGVSAAVPEGSVFHVRLHPVP